MNGLFGPQALEYPGGELASNQAVGVWSAEIGGFLVPLFRDPGGTTSVPNPTQTDELGNLSFWAPPGPYWLEVNGDRIQVVVADQLATGTVDQFEYQMPAAQTTATVAHTLGRDPVAVQVFDESGTLCDGYSVAFTVPGAEVRVGFDIAIAALIRLQ